MNMKGPVRLFAIITLLACAMATGCATDRGDVEPDRVAPLPHWTFNPSMIFPGDGSLFRPEDGVALPDGRLIVVDQAHGLRRVEADGSSAPFGEMVAAGYVHDPPEHGGGANGIAFEPDGVHVLVADIHHGGIFRVDTGSGATERVFQHAYGVNTAVRDSTGAIWFTQSARNTPEGGAAAMWAEVDIPTPGGALLRLGMEDGRLAGEAEVLVDGLYYANGVAIDEANGHLYVAETVGRRVLRYRVDVEAGTLGEREVVLEGVMPDNLELDGRGQLWTVLPLRNELLAIDIATGETHSAFRSLTPAQAENADEFVRRGETATPRLELFNEAAWAPLPGAVTGVILGTDGRPEYLSGLGNDLVRLPR
jgi:sugar lactone lactonase YvrE